MSYLSQAVIALAIILGLYLIYYLIFKLKLVIPTIIGLFFLMIIIVIGTLSYLTEVDDTFEPNIPINVQHVVITNYQEEEGSCYVIDNKSDINKLRKSLKRLSNHIYCEIPEEVLLFVKDDLKTKVLPISSHGYSWKSRYIIGKYRTSKYKRRIYMFKVPKEVKYEDITLNLKKFDEDLIVFYNDNNFDSQHSYIEATYRDECSNYNNIGDVMNKYDLGEFEPDDVFIPLKEYLKNNKLLLSYSKVRFNGSGPDGFERQIKFYLNEDIDEKELNKLSSKFKDDFNYEEPITYVQIDNYTIYVISKQEIVDMDSFTKRFNIMLQEN